LSAHPANLVSPPRSRVTAEELHEEVGEYFSLGLRIRPGDTILDVGANIGAFAARVAATCDGDLRILAFEPSPETFEALTVNFERNALLRKTRHRLFHLGLSSTDDAGQTLRFYDFARFPTNSTFHLSEKRREFEIFFEDRGRRMSASIEKHLGPVLGRGMGGVVERVAASLPKGSLGWWFARQIMGLREHSVPVDTLAHVLSEERVDRIDVLKIDVEGPELEILGGLDELTWAKVQQVVLETHDRDGRLAKILALFRAHDLGEIQMASQKTTDNGLESLLVYARRPGLGAAKPLV
jgi:FkbM family methyltransferase